MPGIVEQGTTFNLPNFVGTLFQVSPSDTPFLSAIGGLTGGREADQKMFEWQTYDLRDPENPSHLEGQDAPDPTHRVRMNVQNLVQIFHQSVNISYTKQSATGQRDGLAASDPASGQDEMSWQQEQHMKQSARDVEVTLLNGTLANPADNSLPRRTQGILGAIETNVTDLAGADLAKDDVDDLMQMVWESGGMQESEAATLMCNAKIKRKLTRLYITDSGYAEETRNIGGVSVQTIETDFGRLNIMLSRYMPADDLAVVSLDVCAPRLLRIADKGHFFWEELAKTGASNKSQLYGEIGLEYGAEIQHGKILNIDTGTTASTQSNSQSEGESEIVSGGTPESKSKSKSDS